MSEKNTLGRRSFLKMGSAIAAAPSVAGKMTLGRSSDRGTEVYSSSFVPDGAECRLAFVADHHYWPNHLENWGGGSQITSSTDRRMPDLVQALNDENPDLSVHAGDVVSAGGSFFPTPEEYARQLAFTKRFYDGLDHPSFPLVGNHETLESHYADESQLQDWIRHFGPPYRHFDHRSWRLITVNSMLPNPDGRHGQGDNYGNVYGLDEAQLNWLKGRLKDAADRRLKVVVCTHVAPSQWLNATEAERAMVSSGCVKAVLCGHWHRNTLSYMGGIPVLTRVANVTSPFGYSMVHLYPDDRMIVVQKSQHFPFDDFVSSGFRSGALGSETDRYLTIGGSSRMSLEGLRVFGPEARATIVDGHLRLASRQGRAAVLIDTAELRHARLTLTAVKAGGEGMGAIALADRDSEGGIEATVTSRYSPDGKVFLARGRSDRRDVLARSWFNISDNIAYRLTLEVRNGRVTASWKNMLDLEAAVDSGGGGYFGFYVERGAMFVTDLKLERLA